MRLIARLDIKNEFVIKGIHLEGLRKVGNVRHFAIYYISPLASLGVLHMSVLFVNWAFSDIETSWYALGVRLFGVLLLPFSFLVSYSTKEIVTSDAYSVALWPRLRLLGITLLGVVALFASFPMLRWLMSSDVMPAILIAAILAAGIFPRAFTFDANTALQFRINPALHLVFTSVSIVALTFAALPSAHLGIEPENNVAMILEAFSGLDMPLVFVGNWEKSEYGRNLKARYAGHPTITILDPIYEPRGLRAIRDRASIYIHGHSAGGTNPSLVEMMHFGIPVLAHGCTFNRYSTEGKARYFMSASELAELLRILTSADGDQIGSNMREIAQRKYTWNQIGKAYFELLERA